MCNGYNIYVMKNSRKRKNNNKKSINIWLHKRAQPAINSPCPESNNHFTTTAAANCFYAAEIWLTQ